MSGVGTLAEAIEHSRKARDTVLKARAMIGEVQFFLETIEGELATDFGAQSSVTRSAGESTREAEVTFGLLTAAAAQIEQLGIVLAGVQ